MASVRGVSGAVSCSTFASGGGDGVESSAVTAFESVVGEDLGLCKGGVEVGFVILLAWGPKARVPWERVMDLRLGGIVVVLMIKRE